MTRLEVMNERQDEAVSEVMSNRGVGTVLMPTGSGKSFVFFKLLYRMLESGWLSKEDHIFFWAETVLREENMRKEGKKFRKEFGKDPHEDFNITYRTYQSGPTNRNRVLDCFDEIDWALSAEYYKTIKSSPMFKLGLTATNTANSNVFRDKVPDEMRGIARQSDWATEQGKMTTFINKGQLIKKLCPIVYEYNFQQAIEEGVISPFKTIVIEHELDNCLRDIKKWKTYEGKCTEKEWYSAREKQRTNYRSSRYLRAKAGKDQAKFLWELPSKVDVVKRLLSKLEGKTVVFSVTTAPLYGVTSNVATNATKSGFTLGDIYFSVKKTKKGKKYKARRISTQEHAVLSEEKYNSCWNTFKERHLEDTELIERFDSGEIDIIAASKKISRGITLSGVENCVLMSYYSKATPFIQRLGRVLRYSEGKVAKLYIIKTLNTHEENWFENLSKIVNDKGEVIGEIDLNITKTIKSHQL